MAGPTTATVTLLFTDVEGSTRLLRQLRGAYAEVLAEHQRLLRAAFERHGGQEVDTQGDSFFVAFTKATDAVLAAVDAQRALATHSWPDGAELRVRMGIHTGSAMVRENRFVGMAVHRAARICTAGHGGQILLSETTRNLLEDEEEVPAIKLRDLGAQTLKDFDRPVRLYQTVVPGLTSEFPPLRTADQVPEPEVLAGAGRAGLTSRIPRDWRLAALAGGAVLALTVPIVVFVGSRGDSTLTTVAANGVGIVDGGKLVAAGSISGSPTEAASGAGSVWVTSTDDQTVARIDPVTGEARETIQAGSGASGVAADDRAVWVTNSLAGNVTRISPQTNAAVDTIDVGAGPVAVALGHASVWVADRDDQTLLRLDDRTGEVKKRIPVGPAPRAVAVGRGVVWVADEVRGALYRVDPEQDSVVAVVNVGTGPVSVAVGFGSVWVANNLDGTISRVDPGRDAVAETIPVGDGPRSLAVGRDGVWVSNEFDGTVRMIDPDTNEVTRTVHVGQRPTGVAAIGNRIVVAVRAAGAAHRGGTLHGLLALPHEPGQQPSFGPSIDTTNYEVIHATSLTNDGLVAYRRAGGVDGSQLVPDLAVALPTSTDGGRTYSFRVRPGIRYSNGKVVQARDFRRALERLLINVRDPIFYGAIVGAEPCVANASKRWETLTKRYGARKGARSYFATIRCDLSHGIVADDASRTVTFHLRGPDPTFLYKLAIPIVAAVPADTPTRDSGTHPLPATGPYMVSSFDPRRELVLVRNPNFHEWSKAARPDGYPDRLVTTLVSSGADAVHAVEEGKADVALEGVPPELQHEVETQHPGLMHVNPLRAVTYLFLNTKEPPFDDIRVRRAVNYGVDRAAGIPVSARGVGADPTCQILPPDFPGYTRYCPFAPGNVWRQPDLARAHRLVAASGTRGALVTVWIPENHSEEAAFAAALFRSLGYRVRLKRVSDGVYYFNEPTSGPLDPARHAQAGAFSWFADYPAASNYMTTFFACDAPSNWSQFCDRHIDAQIKRAVALETTDPYLANRLWARVDREIVDQAPVVPLFTLKNVDIVSRRVGNYQYNPQWGVLIDQLWVR
jgi:YVTN family beta-propeller protein